MFQNKNKVILITLTIIGALLHFYNLTWGAPYYFHPDERNIASSVSQLQFPNQMHPHFFAYGSLPIYTIYFTGAVINYFSSLNSHFSFLTVPFEQAILISRFYSALFATLLIPMLYFLGKKLSNRHSGDERSEDSGIQNNKRFWTSQNDESAGLIAAFLATTSVGLIQFAHFGTFEMWLTFFNSLLFWVCLQKLTKKTLLFMGIIFGILVATKISSLALLPIVLFVISAKAGIQKFKTKFRMTLTKNILQFFFVLITAFLVYFITNPYVFHDTKSFFDSMNYESSLAIGTLPVFYTGEFFNTNPILFQFMFIYPFLLNPLITIVLIPAFFYLCWKSIKIKSYAFMILASFFMILFLSQAFLFAKWTRYMMPTLPFIFLIVGIAVTDFLNTKRQQFSNVTITTIYIICSIFAFSYLITAFTRIDTRVAAYQFATKMIPFDAPILSEVYDLGIVPFNNSYPMIHLFNFYELDNNSPDVTHESLHQTLSQHDYIILPSQRLIKTRLMQQEEFPQGNAFYKQLINEELGFQKIYETPCDMFCKITYLGDPTFRFEQTANVFDHPTVMIFKKRDTIYTKE